jgi:prepilin-type N-terminal cleavage/methylation domain-containing protein
VGPDRRGPQAEAGFTLIELMVVVALLSMVIGIFMSALVIVQNGVARQERRSQANDQLRLAVQQLDREIRSGNVFSDPTAEPNNPTTGQIAGGRSLRVYTQADADTRGGSRCVQWQIAGGRLLRRDWTTTWRSDGLVSGWRVVAEGIVNPSGTPPFVLNTSSTFGNRILDVTFVASPGSGDSDVVVSASITGRNTQYGYPTSVCDDIPPVS